MIKTAENKHMPHLSAVFDEDVSQLTRFIELFSVKHSESVARIKELVLNCGLSIEWFEIPSAAEMVAVAHTWLHPQVGGRNPPKHCFDIPYIRGFLAVGRTDADFEP